MAYVTLATTDKTALGALVLFHSIRATGSKYPIVALYTPHISSHVKDQLTRIFDECILIDQFKSDLDISNRPDLELTFAKLHCWKLIQYEKCVFVDSNVLVLSNIDELFEREELSASRDCGWPDCFSTRLFVFRPSIKTYHNLINMAIAEGSFSGGDHAILNLYFSDWAFKDISKHLPHIFNISIQSFYSYLPAYVRFGSDAKAVSFSGNLLPWSLNFNVATGKVEGSSGEGSQPFLDQWWQIFMDKVYYSLPWQIKKNINLTSDGTKSVLEDRIGEPPKNYVQYETPSPFVPPAVKPFYQATKPGIKQQKSKPEIQKETVVTASRTQPLGREAPLGAAQIQSEPMSEESSDDDEPLDEDLYTKVFMLEVVDSDVDGDYPTPDPPEYTEPEATINAPSCDNFASTKSKPDRVKIGVLSKDEFKTFRKAVREYMRNEELVRQSEDVRYLKHPLEPKDYKWVAAVKDKVSGNYVPKWSDKPKTKIQVKSFKNREDFDEAAGRPRSASCDVNSNMEDRPDNCVAVMVRKFGPDGKKLKKKKVPTATLR